MGWLLPAFICFSKQPKDARTQALFRVRGIPIVHLRKTKQIKVMAGHWKWFSAPLAKPIYLLRASALVVVTAKSDKKYLDSGIEAVDSYCRAL
ncbi:hypothetical protein [Kiloniella sp.]|uniref:hypothetical protein n=1 Tax=Kiloniella sp. TaxID=1938587 RepID=UPI003B01AD0B